jgi:hypothetical protein
MGGPPRRPVPVNVNGIGRIPEKPEALETSIDFGGLSLQDFAAEGTPEPVASPVHTYSAQSVEECMCFAPSPRDFAYRECS